MALRTFRKLQETNEGPNNISYGTLFKAIAKLTVMDEARDAMIEDFFHQCCEEGFVDAFVISQVKAASLTNLYQKLLSPCSMKRRDLNDVDKVVAKIPQDWGKNVIDF